MSEGQGTRGAIILTWRQSPQQSQQQIEVLARSVRYFEQLEQEGIVSQYRVYQDLNGGQNTAVLNGQIDNLIDLVKRVDHRDFLIACQLSLPDFTATTNIGGTNGDAEEVVRVLAQVRNQVDQMSQQQQSYQGRQQSRFFDSGQQHQQSSQQQEGGLMQPQTREFVSSSSSGQGRPSS